MNDTPREALLACAHCGAQMNVREHSAFHPENDCWLAEAGDYGQPIEIDESDYAAWNRRPAPESAAGAVERVADAIEVAVGNAIMSTDWRGYIIAWIVFIIALCLFALGGAQKP